MDMLKFIYILKLFENLYMIFFNNKDILNFLSTCLILVSFKSLDSNKYILITEVCVCFMKLGCILINQYKDIVMIFDITIQVIQILVQNEFKFIDE